MEFAYVIPNDPNAKKNRVPTPTELKTLRNLSQRNQQTMEEFDKRIEEEKNTRAALQHRYEELLELIEGTRSEIIATERSLETLEAQKSLIQADQQKIQALVHPIRRCPLDVLRLIFEWAVETDGFWFLCATNLSHVCRRWRELALQIPHLWTSVLVSLKDKQEGLSAFWSRTVERVKEAAASVVITVDGTSDAHSKAICECRLDLLPNIEHLEFKLQTTEAATFLASTPLYLPSGRVDHLQLNGEGVAALKMDALAISGRFSAIPSLEIHTISQVRFSQGINSTVTTISLVNVENLSLTSLGRAFPSVQIATLNLVKFAPSNTGSPIWPKLKQLTVSWCDNFVWERLAATEITHLSCLNSPNESIITFIASHKSLEHLDIGYSEDLIQSMDTKAPQLLSLTIIVCDEIADRTIMKLSKLTYLGLYDLHHQNHPLTLELFEAIVRSRFFPKKGSRKSSAKTEPPTLEILVEHAPPEGELEWQKSELIVSAHQKVSTTERWNTTYTTYKFQWK